MHSNAGSVPRVNTVTNALRRFFSRDESKSPNTLEGEHILLYRLFFFQNFKFCTRINKIEYGIGSLPTPPIGSSASTANLIGPKYPAQAQGTTRIADQVIEEVDEQLTIQSIRGQEKRPTAQSIFASNNEKIPVRSSPIDVPGSHHSNETKISYERIQSVAPDHQPYLFPSNEVFSTSAPEENMLLRVPSPSVNIVNGDDASRQPSPGSLSREGNSFNIDVAVSLAFADHLYFLPL